MAAEQSVTGRLLCGARRKQGEGTCTRPAGWGTPHVGIGRCKLHGGCSPNHIEHAKAQLRTLAPAAVRKLQDLLDDPETPPETLRRCAVDVLAMVGFHRGGADVVEVEVALSVEGRRAQLLARARALRAGEPMGAEDDEG